MSSDINKFILWFIYVVLISNIYIIYSHKTRCNSHINYKTKLEKYKYTIQKQRDLSFVCINLHHRYDKYEKIKNTFSDSDITINFFQGVQSDNINVEFIKDLFDPSYISFLKKNPRHMGHIGATLSHLNVFQHIIDQQLDITIILEDDVVIATDFEKNILNMISQTTQLDKSWDILYLGFSCSYNDCTHCHKNDHKLIKKNIFHIGYAIGLYGYIINGTRSAKKILDNIFPISNHIDHQIMQLQNNNVIRCYGCVPNIAFHPGKYQISSFDIEYDIPSKNYKSDTNL